jgi:hypothetical protein
MKWRAGAVAVVIASGLMPSSARSAEYQVASCSLLDGQPVGPAIGSGNGWESGETAPVVDVNDVCPIGSHMNMRISGNMGAAQAGWLRWTAAAGTELEGVALRFSANSGLIAANGEGRVDFTLATDRQGLLEQVSPMSAEWGFEGLPIWTTRLLPARYFELRFTCVDSCRPRSVEDGYATVGMALFDVSDSAPPIGGLVGSATDAQVWTGTMRFGLNAADVGGGVYRAVVEVDGVDALTLPLGGASCRDLGPRADVNEFPAAQPCPLRIEDAPLDIDTAALPQGRHTVRVLLEDAAGNGTAAFGPVMRTISATGAIGPGSDPALRGAANGTGASDQARLTVHWGRKGTRALLVSGYGHTHVVRGRLTGPDGAPITGAAIDLVSRTTAVGARDLAKSGPRTRDDGSFVVVLPRGASSRNLTVRYRSHVNDTIPTATAAVHLRVRAGIRLVVRPRVARRGQAIRFAGRLLGVPLPRGGKQIVLMARASRGSWVRFNVVRTGPKGRFRLTYRFQQPGAARYRFRALSLAEAAYPYLAGGSNIVRVVKR